MQKAAAAQACITKGSELPEPWYDHGDFTVLWVLGLEKYRFDDLAFKPFTIGVVE